MGLEDRWLWLPLLVTAVVVVVAEELEKYDEDQQDEQIEQDGVNYVLELRIIHQQLQSAHLRGRVLGHLLIFLF